MKSDSLFSGKRRFCEQINGGKGWPHICTPQSCTISNICKTTFEEKSMHAAIRRQWLKRNAHNSLSLSLFLALEPQCCVVWLSRVKSISSSTQHLTCIPKLTLVPLFFVGIISAKILTLLMSNGKWQNANIVYVLTCPVLVFLFFFIVIGLAISFSRLVHTDISNSIRLEQSFLQCKRIAAATIRTAAAQRTHTSRDKITSRSRLRM